jgi:fatty acid desaturase
MPSSSPSVDTTSSTSSGSNASGRTWRPSYATPRRFGSVFLAECARSVRLVAFWAAIALPCYAIWLLFGGLLAAEVPLFAATVLFDCCALIVGHNHRSTSVPTGGFTH